MVSIQASVTKGWLHENGGFVFNEKYYLKPAVQKNFNHNPAPISYI